MEYGIKPIGTMAHEYRFDPNELDISQDNEGRLNIEIEFQKFL